MHDLEICKQTTNEYDRTQRDSQMNIRTVFTSYQNQFGGRTTGYSYRGKSGLLLYSDRLTDIFTL